MTSTKPFILLFYLLLSLVSSCYIPSVDDHPEGVTDSDPMVYDSPQAIIESHDPVNVVERLRKEGFNFDTIRNSEGLTMLMLAADLRLTNLVLALLSAGVDTTLRSPRSINYVGGWYCVDVIPERSAADFSRKNGDRILAAAIDNYQKLLQLYLIRQQLLANSNAQDGDINFSDLPLEIINTITDKMLHLLK